MNDAYQYESLLTAISTRFDIYIWDESMNGKGATSNIVTRATTMKTGVTSKRFTKSWGQIPGGWAPWFHDIPPEKIGGGLAVDRPNFVGIPEFMVDD